MTDHRPPSMDDDELGTRLRAGLDLLAREAGAAPALTHTETSPARRAPRTWLAAAAVAVVAVVAIGVAYAVNRPDGDDRVSSGDPAAADGARPLLGTRWWLASATNRGADVDIPTTGTRSLGLRFLDGGSCEGIDAGCYDGPRVEGSDACNGVSRKTTIEGATVTLGEDYGAHTGMLCTDLLATVLQDFFSAAEMTYSIDGDELTLTSAEGDVVLTYEAIDTPFGPTSSLVVDDGELDGKPYRLVWADGGLDLEVIDFGSAGVGEDPGRVNAMISPVGDDAYLFGIVPGNAARVVYEPSGHAAEEIHIVDVDDPDFAVIGQVVQAAPSPWELVAYDVAGNEIHRLRWG